MRFAGAGAALVALAACNAAGSADERPVTTRALGIAATTLPPETAAGPATSTASPVTLDVTTVAPTTTTTIRPASTTTIAPPSTPSISPPTTITPPTRPPAAATTTTTTVPALRTACTRVVHIGDSTGLAMWTAADVGDASATLAERYRAVGVAEVFPDNSGGRSMVERLPGQANAIDVAEAVRAGGYRGCWVLMLGTNDAANVAAGGVPGLDERIARMLALIDGDPVLWVNAVSRSTDPVYADAAMQAFNAALARAAATSPNLRILDWAASAQPDWFTSDGLHYTQPGRIWRAALTAQALAQTFPANG